MNDSNNLSEKEQVDRLFLMAEITGANKELRDPIARKIKEQMELTWRHTNPDPNVNSRGEKFWLTAELNGIKLFTRRCMVMDRDMPHEPYTEKKGLIFIFLNKEGSYCFDFNGKAMQNNEAMKATFTYFASKNGTMADKAVWVVGDPLQSVAINSIDESALREDSQGEPDGLR